MGSVRLVAGKRFWVVGAARSLPSDSAAPVGAIAASERGLTITMADGDLLLEGLSDANGVPVPADDVFAQLDGPVAPVLDPPPDRFLAALEDQDPSMARAEASVMRRLRHVPVVEVGSVSGLGALGRRQVVVTEESHSLVEIAAAAAVGVARLTGSLVVPLEVADAPVLAVVAATAPLVRRPIAIVELPEDPDTKFEVAVRSARTALEGSYGDGPWLADLVARDPGFAGVSSEAPWPSTTNAGSPDAELSRPSRVLRCISRWLTVALCSAPRPGQCRKRRWSVPQHS